MKAWEKNVRKVEPYVPGEQPKIDGIIKLNTNENPYPPSEKVMEALKALENDKMRLYPDPEAVELRDEIMNKSVLLNVERSNIVYKSSEITKIELQISSLQMIFIIRLKSYGL